MTEHENTDIPSDVGPEQANPEERVQETPPSSPGTTSQNKQAVWALAIIAVIGLIGMIIWFNEHSATRIAEKKAQSYEAAIELVRNEQWSQAASALEPFVKENYANSKPVSLYVQANLQLQAGKPDQALQTLFSIGNGYTGEFSHEQVMLQAKIVTMGLPSSYAGQEVLQLVSWRWYVDYGYVKVTGQVKNISSQKIDSILAVASIYDKNREFITSESGFIEFLPLLPGQTSPFTIMAIYNPAMEQAMVEFKQFRGGLIPTKYPEKKKR